MRLRELTGRFSTLARIARANKPKPQPGRRHSAHRVVSIRRIDHTESVNWTSCGMCDRAQSPTVIRIILRHEMRFARAGAEQYRVQLPQCGPISWSLERSVTRMPCLLYT